MSRLLTQLDSNLPPSSSTSHADSLPPSPSKGPSKPDSSRIMREWTFPRTSSASSSSSPMTSSHSTGGINSQSTPLLQNHSHGRSSSIAHGSTPSKHESNARDSMRHRSNFSLLQNHPPGTPDLSISLPSASSSSPSLSKGVNAGNVGTGGGGTARMMGYSNLVRRKSLNDLVYFLVFGGAFFLFASSLFGVGYQTATLGELEVRGGGGEGREGVILRDVEIAKGFRELEEEEEVPADVYQSRGDSSHDRGREMMSDSPDDESLNDENTHNTYHPPADSALFPHVEHAHELDEHLERTKEGNRPRPARLPVTEINDDGEEEEEGEFEHAERGGEGHDHDGLEEHDLLDEIEEEEQEEDEEELVDDSISVGTGPNLHLSEEEALESSDESLTALEELLLDADEDENDEEAHELSREEETAQHEAMRHRRPGGGEDGLERLRREREELGRARERWEAALREGREDAEIEDGDVEVEDGERVVGELREKRMKRVRKLR